MRETSVSVSVHRAVGAASLEHCLPYRAPQLRRDIADLRWRECQRKEMRMIQGLENLERDGEDGVCYHREGMG